jgi:hypothetical protein
VCGLWEDKYHIDGYAFGMLRHGFARDTEFTLISKTDNKVTFAIHDTQRRIVIILSVSIWLLRIGWKKTRYT